MKSTFLIFLVFISAVAFAEGNEPIKEVAPAPVPTPAVPKLEILYDCTASSGKETHPVSIQNFRELTQKDPALRMRVGGTWMVFNGFEMNGKENTRMLNLSIQATDKKGRPITAQKSEYYGPPPVKGLYVRLALGKGSISCEYKN